MATILNILSTHIIVPALFLACVSSSKHIRLFGVTTRIEALSFFTAAIAFVAYILLSGTWHVVGYWFRVFFLAFAIIGAVRFFMVLPHTPLRPPTWKSWALVSFYVVLTVVFGALSATALRGLSAPNETVDLRFPLAEGTYAVGQGGSSSLLNYHNVHKSQAYALDILKVNRFGVRASGAFPKDPKRYEIFGDKIFSPCAGDVVWKRDGLADAAGRQTDTANPAGNVAAIECKGVTVFLAHMMRNSIVVSQGQAVKAGDLIGRVGNSGNTTEPHLHIHAEKGPFAGEFSQNSGVAMRFDNRFLVRGSLVFRDEG